MNKNISGNIRIIREMKNFTREYVACEMDMSTSGYGKIERGEIDLTISKINKIADIFGVSIADILFLDVSLLFNRGNRDKRYSNSEVHDYILQS